MKQAFNEREDLYHTIRNFRNKDFREEYPRFQPIHVSKILFVVFILENVLNLICYDIQFFVGESHSVFIPNFYFFFISMLI